MSNFVKKFKFAVSLFYLQFSRVIVLGGNKIEIESVLFIPSATVFTVFAGQRQHTVIVIIYVLFGA